jgi:UDP-N-acetylmuramoyl-tripeptide--D-alanyl-D-alanine ligase
METSLNRNTIKNWVTKGYLKLLKNTDFLVILGIEGKEVAATLLGRMFQDSINILIIRSDGYDLSSKLLKVKKDVDLVIIVLNIDTEKAATNVVNLIKPMMVVLTDINNDGVWADGGEYQYLGVLKKVVNGMKDGGVVIVNNDDANCQLLVNKGDSGCFYYGIGKVPDGLWASNVIIDNFRTRFELNLGVERAEIHSNILGLHMVYPQLAAGAAAVYLGVPLTSIKNSLESAEEFDNQMQVLQGVHGSVVINDTKKISVSSLEGALETLDKVSARKRVLVTTGISGMVDSDKVHQKIARKIFKQNLDYCFFLGREGKIISEELLNLGYAAEKIEDDLTATQIVNKLMKLIGRGDVVLIKGTDQNIEEIGSKLIKE